MSSLQPGVKTWISGTLGIKAMAFSEFELKRIDKSVGLLCNDKVPAHIRNQLRFEYEIDGQNVLIWEVRPAWNDPSSESKMGVAKFRFIKSRNIWKLYWMRQDLKWHAYDPESNSGDLPKLVDIVRNDESRRVWSLSLSPEIGTTY